MRGIRILGLCLAAVLALAATLAATAQAKKLPPITGPVPTSSTWSGTAFEVPGVGTIACTSGSGGGEISNAFIGKEVINFSGCTAKSKTCHTMQPSELKGELNWINAAKKEAGAQLKPAHPKENPFLGNFECEGVTIKVKGSVIEQVGPDNIPSPSSSGKLASESGHQVPESFEGVEEKTIPIAVTSETDGTEIDSTIKASISITNAESEYEGKKAKKEHRPDPTVLHTTGEHPEYGRCQPLKKGKFEDSACTKPKEKHGAPDGKFEFEAI